MHTLSNAAREMIERTIENAHARGGERDNADLARALRRREAIETEIGQLETLIAIARKIAGMKHPSVERILRFQDFGFEADRLAELVVAVESIPVRNNAESI